MFRKWGPSSSSRRRYQRKGSEKALKLHIFPPPRLRCVFVSVHDRKKSNKKKETAPCTLNSKYKSLCIGTHTHSRAREVAISSDWYRGMWNACYSSIHGFQPGPDSAGHLRRNRSASEQQRRRNIFIMFYKTSHIPFLLEIREMSISSHRGLWTNILIFTTPTCLVGHFFISTASIAAAGFARFFRFLAALLHIVANKFAEQRDCCFAHTQIQPTPRRCLLM